MYSHVFLEVYPSSKKREFHLKSNFHILFESYQDKQLMQLHATTKNLSNYDDTKKETSECEQKPIKNFDSFNDEEENQIKKAEKRNADRRNIAEENKAKKCKEKIEQNKTKESKMWNRLNELNGEFKKIKTSKNEQAKKLKPAVIL